MQTFNKSLHSLWSQGMISQEDMNLFLITDDVNRAADEIAFHIDMAVDRNRRAGMSDEDARRAMVAP
jgi:predicted Rossmann-fold nucleotide-binding protein